MAPAAQKYYLPFGFKKAAIQVAGNEKACTFTDTGDVVGVTGHGYANGDKVAFTAIASTTGISTAAYYYVVSAATDTFKVAATAGGSAIALTTNGTGAVRKLVEVDLAFPNKINPSAERKTVSYEGGDQVVKRAKTLGLSFQLDADCLPIGAHAAIFGLDEVSDDLPDGYTAAVPMLTSVERSGVSAGFWGEGDATRYAADGSQSEVTVRQWFPLGTLTAVSSPAQTTGDKPGAFGYEFQSTMEPTADVNGIPLPSGLEGAPYSILEK